MQYSPARYRAEATSVEGFVQQLACCYLRHGYWWYVCGWIPEGKDPTAVDLKLIKKYDIAVSESTRGKKLGRANMQYIRCGRFFVLLATNGSHPFKGEEQSSIRDIRRVPIKFGGYSIGYRRGHRTRAGEPDARWHSHVEIDRRNYNELKAYFVDLAVCRSADKLALEFYRLPFEPYAPIRRQVLNIHRAVNKARKGAGFAEIPKEVLPFRRRVVRPFGRWETAAGQRTKDERYLSSQ